MPDVPPPGPAEFDAYAVGGYQGGMDDPLKRRFGRDLDQFLLPKVRWLLADGSNTAARRMLDFGCGNGQFLRLLRAEGYAGELTGADVSAGMLAEAQVQWRGDRPPAWTAFAPGEALPFADGSFDDAVACCVFHHIPPAARAFAAGELRRLVKPGGRLAVFEHNPFHPMTQLVVCRASIDRDAILLSARSCRRLLHAAGFGTTRTRHLLVAPPNLPGAASLDRRLARLPLGTQYVVEAW